ncbi:hypothetical protein ACIGO6_12675 [Streptomyces sp. NPDC053750]|uniref:hypothetical protein n=1 Tax=Streptomyces sp. NPDC053750 TaxID=3365714 RepID=UPI0037D07CF6
MDATSPTRSAGHAGAGLDGDDVGASRVQAGCRGPAQVPALSGNSRLGTATNSEHYIHVDEPGVAVQACQVTRPWR